MANLTCPSPTDIKPLLGSGNYIFSVAKFPDITFMVQEANLPALELGVAMMSTAVSDVPVPGEEVKFSPLTISFIVDDKLTNYLAINDWMVAMGFPEDHVMYKDLMKRLTSALSSSELSRGFTDATLTILGNNNVPVLQAFFADCFPTSLSGIRFTSTNTDAVPIVAEVTFMYNYYTLRTAT